MLCPDLKSFCRLAKKANIVPVYKEVLADLETPVSAFLKISGNSSHAFLLESVEGQEKIGRYSFIGADFFLTFKSKGNKVRICERGREKECAVGKGDPLENLKEIMREYRPPSTSALPIFAGGAVGYLSYDLVRFFEKLPDKNPDALGLPDAYFLLTDTFLIFDHIEHSIKIVCNARVADGNPASAHASARRNIEVIERRLKTGRVSHIDYSPNNKEILFNSNFTKAEFTEAVRKIKAYVRGGDIIQAVLSQRFSAKIDIEPFNLYRALRVVNPSPYMFYFKLPECSIIGSSPEIFLRIENGRAILRPIAGTRPRGKTPDEDRKLEKELLKDKKEKAEHLMLVDLGRNDLGRICEYGSVRPSDSMNVERYSHVMHIVSEVTGKMKRGKDCFDAVRACFPAGTVSGAPKIRAMEIIEETEKEKRGIYAGAIGYFSYNGNMDTAITIRTILMLDSRCCIQSGAGIVADSVPEKEYSETLNKAKAMLKAISVTSGLRKKK